MTEEKRKWPFASSILLEKKRFDPEKLQQDLLKDWSIDITEAMSKDPNALVFKYNEMVCTITYLPARVPHNEAGSAARFNAFFPGAVRVANTHKAHIMIVILGRHASPKEIGEVLVKLSVSCLKQEYATGIYTIGTVFEPGFYIRAAMSAFANGQYPVANLVFYEVYSNDGGKTSSISTYGLSAFRKTEMEVLDSSRKPNDLISLMMDISFYLIQTDANLIDGEQFEYRPGLFIPVHKVVDERYNMEFMKLDY